MTIRKWIRERFRRVHFHVTDRGHPIEAPGLSGGGGGGYGDQALGRQQIPPLIGIDANTESDENLPDFRVEEEQSDSDRQRARL